MEVSERIINDSDIELSIHQFNLGKLATRLEELSGKYPEIDDIADGIGNI